MKRLLITLTLFSSAFISYGQWATSGTDIYSTNSGDVGIGITSPDRKFYVQSTYSNNSKIATFSRLTGGESTAISVYGYPTSTTSNSYLKGTIMLYVGGNNTQHLNITNPKSNGTIRFHTGGWQYSSTERMIISSNGYVGINRTPSYRLDVNGNIRVNSTIYTSDERVKKNIRDLDDNAISKLSMIRGVTYNMKDDPSNRQKIGFLAQEIQKTFPELVYEDNDGVLGVDYVSLIPVLVESINDLKKENTELSLRLDQLDNSSPKKTSLKTVVYQNSPNPFNVNSNIKYFIADGDQNASIYLYNFNGNQIGEYHNLKKGNGAIDISAASLEPGIYIYTMVVDGKEVNTKRMIITK